MSSVTINSSFSYSLQATVSRSTQTFTLPSGTSRALVLFGVWGGGSGFNTPMSGNTTPTFGGVQLSEVTRPTGGTNVFQSMTWFLPISDGSSGDYPLVTVKQQASDAFEAVGFFLSNVSSVYSSVVSTNLTAGPMGLLSGSLVPNTVATDLILGAAFSASGSTGGQQTKLGDGTELYSNLTVGGGTISGIYSPSMSVFHAQGLSSVSVQYGLVDAQRWRLHTLSLRAFGADSQQTLAGAVISSATTSSTASSIQTCAVTKDGSGNQVVIVYVAAEDGPATGVLPIVRIEGALASMIARSDTANPTGSQPEEIRSTAWLSNVTGTGSSIVSVQCNGSFGVLACCMVGVDQSNPVSSYSLGMNNFSGGPVQSTASVSYDTQQAIGFGVMNFGKSLAQGSGESLVGFVDWGAGSSSTDFYLIGTTKEPSVPAVTLAETASGSGRWRHMTIILNLDGTQPPASPAVGSPYFYRRRQHPSDW